MSRMKQVLEMTQDVDWDMLDTIKEFRLEGLRKRQVAAHKQSLRKYASNSLATGAELCDNMSGD